MNPPIPGLRPLFNKSNSAQRVEIIVPAGDEIHVTDTVAAQLPASFAAVVDLDAVAVEGVEGERPDDAEPGVQAEGDTSGLPPAIEKPTAKRGKK